MKRLVSYCLIGVTAVAVFAGSTFAADRAANVRVNPLGLLIGTLGAEIDIGVGESVTVGPAVSLMSLTAGTTSVNAFSFGVRANFYLGGPRFTDGWFVGPSAIYAPMTITVGDATGSANAFAIGAVAGYQWVWDSGFNINLAGGAAYYTAAADVTLDDDTSIAMPGFSGVGPALEFSLGWAF